MEDKKAQRAEMAQAQRGKIKVKRGESIDDEVMIAKQIEDFKDDL